MKCWEVITRKKPGLENDIRMAIVPGIKLFQKKFKNNVNRYVIPLGFMCFAQTLEDVNHQVEKWGNTPPILWHGSPRKQPVKNDSETYYKITSRPGIPVHYEHSRYLVKINGIDPGFNRIETLYNNPGKPFDNLLVIVSKADFNEFAKNNNIKLLYSDNCQLQITADKRAEILNETL